MAQKVYTLTPLTGVHIGTGEELTPLDYKIASGVKDLDFKKQTYIKFSSDRILQRLISEKNQQAMAAFERASVNGNMKELQKFFQDNCEYKNDTDYPCDITKGFYTTYNANLNKDPHQNEARVSQMYHIAGKPQPVIPGSSIKGSIRTALLNTILAGLSDEIHDRMEDDFNNEKNAGRFEERVQKYLLNYSDAKEDPLRALLIPDCNFKISGTQIVGNLRIVSLDKNEGCLGSVGTQLQAEVLRGTLLDGKAVSDIAVEINNNLQKTPINDKYMKTISFEDIRKGCNYFYWREFQKEYDNFYKDVSDGTESLIVKLKSMLEKAVNTENQFILRVGRWSQVEFVTFEETFRKPETKKDKFGKPLGYGATRTLFDYDGKYVPMGWCVLSEKEEKQ